MTVCYSQEVHENRVACVGRVRWVATIAMIGAAALGLCALVVSEPPEVPTPPVICRVPVVTPIPTPVPEPEPYAACACAALTDGMNGMISIEQQRTLELACRMYSDEQCRYPFKLFATPTQGDRTAVIVTRSTGDCGGCGALTIAAMFDHHELQAIGELGEYGRFGNGPDGARFVTVAGGPAIELAWSGSMGGYSSDYRTVFTRHHDGFKQGVCIVTAWDDGGAHANATEWKANLRYFEDGAINVRYTSIKRGEAKPVLDPVTIGFDRRARLWLHDRQVDSCVTPPRPDLIDL